MRGDNDNESESRLPNAVSSAIAAVGSDETEVVEKPLLMSLPRRRGDKRRPHARGKGSYEDDATERSGGAMSSHPMSVVSVSLDSHNPPLLCFPTSFKSMWSVFMLMVCALCLDICSAADPVEGIYLSLSITVTSRLVEMCMSLFKGTGLLLRFP